MLRHCLRQNFLLAILSIGALSIAPALAQPQCGAKNATPEQAVTSPVVFVII